MALVRNLEAEKRWMISYAEINLDGANVEFREQQKLGLSRLSVAISCAFYAYTSIELADRKTPQPSGDRHGKRDPATRREGLPLSIS